MSHVIFVPAFIAAVVATLDQKCPTGSGASISSSSLAEELKLGDGMESLFGLLFKQNLLPGWEMSRERRGIGRAGEKKAAPPPKAEPLRQRREKESDDEFRTKLVATLASCIKPGSVMTRTDVGVALGKPCGETEIRISNAFRKLGEHRVLLVDDTTGYITKKGPWGGICHLSPEDLKSFWTLAHQVDEAAKQAEAQAQADVAAQTEGEGVLTNEGEPEASSALVEVAPPVVEEAPPVEAEATPPVAEAAPPTKGKKNGSKKGRRDAHA